MGMLKDESKEQIPLFDLPEIQKESPTATATEPAPTPKNEISPVKKKVVIGDGIPASATSGSGGMRKTGRDLKKTVLKSPLSGLVPEGDVRLTANIRADLHLKLKIAAARRRTTIGELLEELVEKYL